MAGKFSVEAVFKAVDKITRPVQRMDTAVGKFSRGAVKSLKVVTRAANKVRTSFVNVGTAAAKFGAFGAIAGGTAVTLFNKATVEADMLAKSVGISVDLLEGLANSVRPGGFELDNIVDLVEEMNNKLGESAGLKEITPVTESLGILGLRFRDLKKLKPEEQFKKITDAALKMEDAQKAASAVDILMGGEANKIIGLLRLRGKTVDGILKAQAEFNFKSAEGRTGAGKFVDELAKIELGLFSIGSEISGLLGEKLTPLLIKVSDGMANNKESIVDFIDATVSKLEELTGKTVTFVKSIDQKKLDNVLQFAEGLTKVITLAGEALMGLFKFGQGIRGVIDDVSDNGIVASTMKGVDKAVSFFTGSPPAQPTVQGTTPTQSNDKSSAEITIRNETKNDITSSGNLGKSGTLKMAPSGSF